MPIIYHVAPDGTRTKLAEGVPGGKGDPGPQGDSAFDIWNAANGGTKTQADFLAYIGPDYVPSQVSVTASGLTSVPSSSSLAVVTPSATCELSIADVTTEHGTNVDGTTFTIYVPSGFNLISWDPLLSVYGMPGDASAMSEAWCTVVRASGSWRVLVGHTA